MRILIVEEDIAAAVDLIRLMRKWGHRVIRVAGGKDAVQGVSGSPCDVAFINISLADEDAATLIPSLKAICPDIRIITMSDHNNEKLEARIRALGIVFYMAKPLHWELLKDLLDHMSQDRSFHNGNGVARTRSLTGCCRPRHGTEFMKDNSGNQRRRKMGTHDNRGHSRKAFQAPVAYSGNGVEGLREGTIFNIGKGGLYFESDQALDRGAEVYVRIKKPAVGLSGACPVHMGKVRWCAGKSGPVDASEYGAGVETTLRGSLLRTEDPTCKVYACDLCGACGLKEIHQTEEGVFLCYNCFARLGELERGQIQDCISRFAVGNVV